MDVGKDESKKDETKKSDSGSLLPSLEKSINGETPSVLKSIKPSGAKEALTVKSRNESIKAIKSLIKTMILGLKTVVWCVSNYKENHEPTARSPRGTQTPLLFR